MNPSKPVTERKSVGADIYHVTPILVTGGTGRQGGTGRAVIKELLDNGLPVKALVRTIDERAVRLKNMGAEIIVGDYMDYSSLEVALKGVKIAYFCYPVATGITEAAGMFAAAGRLQGLERIVDLSLGGSANHAASPQLRAQWIVEQIFEWAGFEGVHLRVAAFYMENVSLIEGRNIRSKGGIANAFGDIPLSWISGADVGAIAAGLMMNPRLTSERSLTIGGVERLSYEQIATTISDVVGKNVYYKELTPEEWHKVLVDASIAAGKPNTRGADHLVAQSINIKKSTERIVTDHVQKFMGRAPISFAEFVRERLEEFIPQQENFNL